MSEEIVRILTAVIGAMAVLGVLFDVAVSTLSGRSAGPLLKRLAPFVWRGVRRFAVATRSDAALGNSGAVILVAAVATWLLLLWLGWTAIFCGGEAAVLNSQDKDPADLLERLYFAGFSVTTLGVGDYVANGPLWEILTVLAAFSGFSVLTLSVTFLLSLLPAVADKRSAANYVAALGGTPYGLIEQHWSEGHARSLLPHVPNLVRDLEGMAQKYTAYPMLQYFHATERRSTLALRVASLSEALLFLESGAVRCDATAHGIRPLRRSIDSLLETLTEVYLDDQAEAPPLPELDRLPGDVPVDPQGAKRLAEAHQERRRRLLRTFVEQEGWRWEHVYDPP